MCSDPPNTDGMNQAAVDNVALGKDALEFYKKAYADQQPLVQRASERADEVSRAQLDSMRNQDRIATEADAYRKGTFEPVEKKIVADSMTFNTDAERERLAGLAGADTAQSFGAARAQLRRDTGRAGLSPADGGYTAGLADLAGREATTISFNKNKARSDARTLGRAQLMDAAALGRGLPSQQATAAGLALTAGDRSAATGALPVTLAQGSTSQVGQGYGTAMQGNQNAANIFGSIAGLQSGVDASNGQQAGAAGGAIASIGMAVAI